MNKEYGVQAFRLKELGSLKAGFHALFGGVAHVVLRRPERMKIVGRVWGKPAVCLDSFDAVFRENQANCQFALPFLRRFLEIFD
jgi:hypothetical protein